MKAPATLDELCRTFPTERRCGEALRRMRWPHGFRCSRCEGRQAHRLRSRGLWPCAACRDQASLTAGTPFHGTRVPRRTWLLAIFFVARHKQGISALQLQRDAGLGSSKTARMLLHKVRSTLAHDPLFPLEGDVEVDESSVGGYRPGRKGRGVGKAGVVIAVERCEKTAGSMRLTRILRATRAVWITFVQGSIRPEKTTVFTDAWGSYKALGQLGIDHRPRKGGHGRQALDILPWAHTVFGNLETWLRGTFHGVSRSTCNAISTRSATASIAAGARASSSASSCAASQAASLCPTGSSWRRGRHRQRRNNHPTGARLGLRMLALAAVATAALAPACIWAGCCDVVKLDPETPAVSVRACEPDAVGACGTVLFEETLPLGASRVASVSPARPWSTRREESDPATGLWLPPVTAIFEWWGR